METVGIICEYNPFHNGHLYHINKCKEMFPNAIIVLILNGYFLQRGELSILTKEDKTKIALEAGVNLVIELPFVFGSQAADIFAYNSITLLNELKVDKIVFGSECDDKDKLVSIAQKQLDSNDIKDSLNNGESYPKAMAKALGNDINSPNDILGISYIKAILQINKKIDFYPIQRTNDYHDIDSNDEIVSATNIRSKINNREDIKMFLPKYSYDCINNANFDYFNLLKYKIISEDNLEKYLTVDEGIENRLKEKIDECSTLEEFINAVKTKRYTFNRINRMFIHILIGLKKEDIKKMKIDYIRVLGFDNLGKKCLNSIKKDLKLPFSLKSKVFDYEYKASKIYDLITGLDTFEFEKRNKPVEKN